MDISNIDVEAIDNRITKDFDILKENCSNSFFLNPSFLDTFSSICRYIIYNYNKNYSITSNDDGISICSTGTLENDRFSVECSYSMEEDTLIVNSVYKNICEIDTGCEFHSLEFVDKYDKNGVLIVHIEFERDIPFDEFDELKEIIDEHLIWNDYNYFPKLPKRCDSGRIQSMIRDPRSFGVARVVEFSVKGNIFSDLNEKYYMLNSDFPLTLCLDDNPFMFCNNKEGKYIVDSDRFGDIDKDSAYRMASTIYVENIKNSDLINTNKNLYNYIVGLLE